MKVLHFFKTYWPDTFGGVERTIPAIATSPAPLGVETTVLALSPDPDRAPEMFDGHRLLKAKLDIDIASTGFSREAFGAFNRAARDVDIVHYHFPWPFMDVVHFASRLGKPSLVTYHSDIVKQRTLKLAYAPLMHRFLADMHAIVATSPNYLETSSILPHYREKTRIIPIGLDETEYPASKPDRLMLWRSRFERPFFLFTGVLRYYKGLDVLVDAAKNVAADIVVIGTGPMEGPLRRQAEKGGVSNIHFVGAVDDEDKSALLHLAYGFVFPATQRSEAFGPALLEGAMAGLPLVSTELGTGTSYVNRDGETGIVVAPNDPVALAKAMNEIVDWPERAARFGSAARLRFDRTFTGSRMGEAYFRLYSELVVH